MEKQLLKHKKGCPCKAAFLLFLVGTLAFQFIEDDLAHTHALGGHFYIFVGLDVFQRFFQREDYRRNDAGFVVRARCTHIGKLLRLGDVDDQIFFVNVFAHYLAGIDFVLRIDEEFTTVLQLVDGVCKGRSAFHGNHRTVASAFDVALVRLVFFEAVCHNGFSLRSCQYIGSQADNTTRWHIELDVHTVALGFHRGHFATTAGHHINHLAAELFGYADGQLFDGFALHAVYFLIDYLRLAYLQLITFTAHGFNQDREVQYTTS